MAARAMKIATFNVNHINNRLQNLLDWLAEAQPDVVCLQETKTIDRLFPRKAIREAGYGVIYTGQSAWNGVAILAKEVDPIEVRRTLPGDDSDKQPRYIEAAVGGVLIACIYAPNGNPQPGPKFDYKLAWHARLETHAAGLLASGLPIVLAGDYNIVPTEFDIYPNHSYAKDALLQPESRASYQRLLQQGWTDALRTKYPSERIYTYWSYMRNRWPRNAGLRLDHLLLSPAVVKRVAAAGIDKAVRGRENASDHAPVWISIR
jgi:exodeoxyribonuclease-3